MEKPCGFNHPAIRYYKLRIRALLESRTASDCGAPTPDFTASLTLRVFCVLKALVTRVNSSTTGAAGPCEAELGTGLALARRGAAGATGGVGGGGGGVTKGCAAGAGGAIPGAARFPTFGIAPKRRVKCATVPSPIPETPPPVGTGVRGGGRELESVEHHPVLSGVLSLTISNLYKHCE